MYEDGMNSQGMRKQAWVHLHGLMWEIAGYYEERTGDEIDMEGYEELEVRPTSIHKPKTDHKAAVFSLADSITDSMEDTEDYDPVFDPIVGRKGGRGPF